ncbi:hypothetical protein MTF64_12725 [Pseudoalteromonas sp. 2CM41L]|uniref:hypothetical protein n=1 Tax=Pseudoalteromonas sp. 2CM41L TaxID=2929857 RepID=UPI0020C07C03|nr:hypothetical protein [Pseudoalteromonas sp. 2CM41L]MCK8107741.1 hypothetical protein [Pseudoalteromonas sp. 2CM41L]
MKIYLHFYLDSDEQVNAEIKKDVVREKLTKASKGNSNHRKYSELYFHLVEYLYKAFSFKSRVNVYAILSKHFPIDELPRRIPSSNQLINTVNNLAISYDGYPVTNFDKEHDEHHVSVIFLHSKPHIQFIHMPNTELDKLTPLSSIELPVVKGYHKQARLQSTERIALSKFYKENIELITNIRSFAYFRERDITLGLLARAMSPFWLKVSSLTNLEEQSDLIKETLASVESEGFKFIQHKSKKRIPRNDEAKLIEITLDINGRISTDKLYAILLKHSEEGIYISLLNSIAVSNFESDESVKREMLLHEWVKFLNESYVPDGWVLECEYTYKYDKYRNQYYKNEISIKTIGEMLFDDATNIKEKYKLVQKSALLSDYGVTSKKVYDRCLTPSPRQRKPDFPDLINTVDFTIDYKKPLKLNLSQLTITTKEELTDLLNGWATALDTFTDEDIKRLLFPPLKKPLTIGRLRRKK